MREREKRRKKTSQFFLQSNTLALICICLLILLIYFFYFIKSLNFFSYIFLIIIFELNPNNYIVFNVIIREKERKMLLCIYHIHAL